MWLPLPPPPPPSFIRRSGELTAFFGKILGLGQFVSCVVGRSSGGGGDGDGGGAVGFKIGEIGKEKAGKEVSKCCACVLVVFLC